MTLTRQVIEDANLELEAGAQAGIAEVMRTDARGSCDNYDAAYQAWVKVRDRVLAGARTPYTLDDLRKAFEAGHIFGYHVRWEEEEQWEGDSPAPTTWQTLNGFGGSEKEGDQ